MRRSPIERIVAYVVAGGFTVFAIFPVVWALNISLKFEKDIITRRFTFWPNPATLTNYVAIWTQSNLPDLMWNSAVTTFFTVAICVVAGTMAAYSVARMRFRGREMDHVEIGRQVLDRVQEQLKDAAKVEQHPKMEGKQIIMLVGPK